MAEQLLPKHATIQAGLKSVPLRVCVFFRKGEYWTVGYSEQSFAVRDAKGFSYIRLLIERPGEEIHALDLVQASEPAIEGTESFRQLVTIDDPTLSIGGLGDAGELLDAEAKRQYRRRYAELEEQTSDLLERGDVDGAERVRSEMDFLAREIARAVGLGGRDRRSGSSAERARLNVTRAIRTALHKIAEHDASFGELLSQTIQTGTFCSYAPDLRSSIAWQFAEERSPVVNESRPEPRPLFRRPANLLNALANRSTFVGRGPEDAALERALAGTVSGSGRVVLIDGPAGVGKTRLAAELCAKAAESDIFTLSGCCYDRDGSVAFMPFVEMLESVLEAQGPEAFRRALGDEAPEIARLLPQLRRIFPDLPPAMDLPPEQSRRILFKAVGDLLQRAGENTPTLIVIDDLQWADEGTLELLNYFAHLVTRTRALIVGTFRDFELQPGHPLARTIDEMVRFRLVDRITLRGLAEESVAEMLKILSGRDVPKTIVHTFHESTEGNPFFIEELYRHLHDQGRVFEPNGELRAVLTFDDSDVPQSVRLVIGRRLARLSEPKLRTFGVAAIIGRSFTFQLLKNAVVEDEERLLDYLEEAEQGGLITSRAEYPDARFTFSHDLIRQVVLAGLKPSRRQRIHLEVANAIERVFTGELEDRAADLAHHLWQAGSAADPARTIRYLTLAAQQAVTRSANVEAIALLGKGLKLLTAIPKGLTRDQTELGLQLALGQSLTFAKGYSASEVQTAFDRARELCSNLGETPHLYPVLYGLWGYYLVRGEYGASEEIGYQLLSLAERYNDSNLLLEGHTASGLNSFYRSCQLDAARAHFEKALTLYDPQVHKAHALKYGQDPGVVANAMLSWTLWIQGYPARAYAASQESIRLAREQSHKYSLAYALAHGATFCQFIRDTRLGKQLAEEGIALSAEEGFAYLLLAARFTFGWTLNQLAESGEAAKVLREAKDACRELGAPATGTHQHGLLADALGNCGQIEEALDAIRQGLAQVDSTEEEYYEAELYRLRGELLLISPERDEAAAEVAFVKSLEVARQQSAKSWELRTATSLYRLKLDKGDASPTRVLLASLYNSFTEGFETPDLRDAHALLSRA